MEVLRRINARTTKPFAFLDQIIVETVGRRRSGNPHQGILLCQDFLAEVGMIRNSDFFTSSAAIG
jgi:hypothetical protein